MLLNHHRLEQQHAFWWERLSAANDTLIVAGMSLPHGVLFDETVC